LIRAVLAARHEAENTPHPKRFTYDVRYGGHRHGRENRMAVEIRPAQALKLLHDFSYALVTDRQPDLSPRQLTILLTIYLDPPPHNVRGLARKLKVTKPVITRALDTMGKLGLVARRRDDADRRNVVIQRTVKGALAVEQLGDLLVRTAKGLAR
jgi:DNA-binding MarR family transcriptional regulator